MIDDLSAPDRVEAVALEPAPPSATAFGIAPPSSLDGPVPDGQGQANAMPVRLKDRVVLLVGADGDVGPAIARGFAREGAKVALMAAARDRRGPARSDAVGHRRSRDAGAAVERLRAGIEADGSAVMALTGDPDAFECAMDAVRRVIETWGAVDALVLDSTGRDGAEPAPSPLVRAARPYLGRGASLVNVAHGTRTVPAGPALIEHASIRAARTGFVRATLADLARAGIAADGVGGTGRQSAFARLPPGTGALGGFGRHVLSLRDGRAEAVAACVLHLARADADWTASRA